MLYPAELRGLAWHAALIILIFLRTYGEPTRGSPDAKPVASHDDATPDSKRAGPYRHGWSVGNRAGEEKAGCCNSGREVQEVSGFPLGEAGGLPLVGAPIVPSR